jgi:hypothetical protein
MVPCGISRGDRTGKARLLVRMQGLYTSRSRHVSLFLSADKSGCSHFVLRRPASLLTHGPYFNSRLGILLPGWSSNSQVHFVLYQIYILVEKFVQNFSRNLDVDEMIILNCILRKEDRKMWTGFIWFAIRSSCRIL